MIWYHGTSKSKSERHLEKGFPEGTFFAKHLEDALSFGGEYIFWIFFKENPTDYWEYVCDEVISSDKILMLIKVDIEKLYYSKGVAKQITKNFIRENFGKEPCKDCGGRGQNEVYEWLGKFRAEQICTLCETCQGHGYEHYNI